MNRAEILDVITTSIKEETRATDAFEVTEDTSADMVPGWDSLAHVRIVMGIEFDLDLPETFAIEETYKAKNIGELIDILIPYTDRQQAAG